MNGAVINAKGKQNENNGNKRKAVNEENGNKKSRRTYKKEGLHYYYTEELQKMLHCFGDVPTATKDTARFLEQACKVVVGDIIHEIVQKHSSTPQNADTSNENASNATSPSKKKIRLAIETIIESLPAWIDRNRVEEIRKFLLNNRKLERVAQNSGCLEEDNRTDPTFDSENIEPEDIETAEQDWDFSDNEDQSNNNKNSNSKSINSYRAKRREAITRELSREEYLYYAECSKVSFVRPHKRKKFVEFIELSKYPFYKTVESEPLDILGQILYEFAEGIVWKAKCHLLREAFQNTNQLSSMSTLSSFNDKSSLLTTTTQKEEVTDNNNGSDEDSDIMKPEMLSVLMLCRPLTPQDIHAVLMDMYGHCEWINNIGNNAKQ